MYLDKDPFGRCERGDANGVVKASAYRVSTEGLVDPPATKSPKIASVAADGSRWLGTLSHNAEAGDAIVPSSSSKLRPSAMRRSTWLKIEVSP